MLMLKFRFYSGMMSERLSRKWLKKQEEEQQAWKGRPVVVGNCIGHIMTSDVFADSDPGRTLKIISFSFFVLYLNLKHTSMSSLSHITLFVRMKSRFQTQHF